MLVELEIAILEELAKVSPALKAKIFDFKVDRLPRRQTFLPTIFLSIEAAEFEDGPDESFYQDVFLFMLVVFTDLEGEATRRKGIYPFLQGVIGILASQKLELDIDPISPVGLQNVTEEDDARNGEIKYQLKFQTRFKVDKAAEDPAPADLLTLAVEYFLQEPSDDGLVDAADVIE